jgi:M6 family metalloprotease-like protein
MKKYILLTLIALLCGNQLMHAVPAYPGKITVTQPDGTRLTLRQHGDEWGHWFTDEAGRMILQGEDGFCRTLSDEEAETIRQRAAEKRNARRRVLAQRSSRARREPIVGQRRFLVILVEFDDVSFQEENDRQAFFDKMNLPGYSRNDATGSARDFFLDNSDGRFDPVFDVFGPVKLTEGYAYYGENNKYGIDMHPATAVADGCSALDEEVDFSVYDNDGDGKVDLVYMYYAGYGEADGGGGDTIWPHQSELTGFGIRLTLDDVQIDSYACSNECAGTGKTQGKMDGIGSACHEFGHALGLPDFYDSDGSTSGYAGGLYTYSVMSNGLYNNESRTPPYYNFEERLLLGWVDESDYLEFDKSGRYTIPPIRENVAYRTFTDMDGEYFVYENRTKTGWDQYLPAAGMIVYHVDKSSRQVGYMTAQEMWEYARETNMINTYGSHPCFYIVPAANQLSLYYRYEKRMPFPYQGINSYVPLSWNNVEGDITFSQIAFADGLVTLWAHVPSEELDYMTIAGAGSYHAGDRFTFELVQTDEMEAPETVVWLYDDEPAGADAVTLTAGPHTVEARLTFADGRKDILTLEIDVQ